MSNSKTALVAGVSIAIFLATWESTVAQHHTRVPAVPPADEIVVLDPHVDPEGKPKVLLTDAEGGQSVDIPPTVIVHRYYYTGDREFRGPNLPGGPSIVVVNHPRTGERLYVDVQMLPGSPHVIYRHCGIIYDYGDHVIELTFKNPVIPFHLGRPRIVYRHGRSIVDKVVETHERHREHVSQWVQRTGLPKAATSVAGAAGNIANQSADLIHDTGEIIVAPVVLLVETTPLGSLVDPGPEELATQERDRLNEEVSRQRERLNASIPTLR